MKNKFFLLILVTSLFLPPLLLHMAQKSAYELQQKLLSDENEERALNALRLLEVSALGHKELFRQISNIRQKSYSEGYIPLSDEYFENLEKELKRQVHAIVRDYPLPMQGISLVLAGNKVNCQLFGPELGLEKMLPVLANPEFFCNRKPGSFTLQLPTSHTPAEDHLLLHFAQKKENHIITHLAFRSLKGVRNLILLKVNQDSFVLFLLNRIIQDSEKILQQKLATFSEDVIVGAYQKSHQRLIFGRNKAIDEKLNRTMVKILADSPPSNEKYNLSKSVMLAGKNNPRMAHRFFAIIPLPVPYSGPGPLVLLLFIFSCTTMVMLFEKIAFNRGPDFSLKILIPLIFIFIVLQPLFAAVYFFQEYYHSSYVSYRNQVLSDLNSELRSLDDQNFDNAKFTVDLAKNLNSIEKITSYAGVAASTSIELLSESLLQELRRKQGDAYYKALWMVTEDGVFLAWEWDGAKLFKKSETVSDIADIFKSRFLNLIRFNNGEKIVSYRDGLDRDSLKIEFARSFMLNLLGHEAFYEFRRYSEFLIEIFTNLKKDFIFCVPITSARKTTGVYAWHITSTTLQRSFPVERLEATNERQRIIMNNREIQLFSEPLAWEEIEKRFPQLAATVTNTNHNRARTTTAVVGSQSQTIYDAIPSIHSALTIAGNSTMLTYDAFRSRLAQKINLRLGAGIILGVFIAWLAALYFVAPLEQLTKATVQIECGNFSYRLNQNHPDDFAQIAAAFNRMAKKLEQGQILRLFVSESVRKEVAEENSETLAGKAELKQATIIFSGIFQFKQKIKQQSPELILEALRHHLQAAAAATAEFGGEIDKMIEDKIMIVFEHDDAKKNYDVAAVQVAREINRKMQQLYQIKTVAGINSGLTVAGIMGAERARLARTVIGDPVNLAARLAAEAEKHNAELVVSDNVLHRLPGTICSAKLPITSVKGKTQSIRAYKIVRGADHV